MSAERAVAAITRPGIRTSRAAAAARIAFLWFIGVMRDRLGEDQDRFFATVFLGSGLLFVAMLFTAGAIAGGLIVTAAPNNHDVVALGSVWSFARRVTVTLTTVDATRIAAVVHHLHHHPRRTPGSHAPLADQPRLRHRGGTAVRHRLRGVARTALSARVFVLSLHLLIVTFRTSPVRG